MPKKTLSPLANIINLVKNSQPEKDSPTPEKADSEAGGKTFLIVGLGNPGAEYANTRHNIGFMLVDNLAARLGVSFTRMKHKALVVDTIYQDHKIVLMKPQTYMNLSGQSVAPLMKLYDVSIKNLLVVYDEMDIPLGTIRIRPKGGSGGQKGMKSIIERLGNEDGFPRLRLGIGRPPGRMSPSKFLLRRFSRDEEEQLVPLLDNATDAVLTHITEGLNKAMNTYNGKIGEFK